MSHQVLESTACYNCGATLSGAYCGTCGQKALPVNPGVQEFLHELTHELLHVDGKIFRSVKKLLVAPGFLTVEHLQGRRARWVAPIRLYLIFSLVYFSISAIAPAGSMRVTVAGKTQEDEVQALNRIGYSSENELRETVAHARHTWAPRIMFLLVPLFAYFIQLSARGTGRNYPQHLYFGLHLHAAWFAAGAVAAAGALLLPVVASEVVSALAVVYGLTYAVLAYRTAYGRTIGQAIWRSALVLAAYWVATIGALLGVLLTAIFGHK
jgi:hypothetical protein